MASSKVPGKACPSLPNGKANNSARGSVAVGVVTAWLASLTPAQRTQAWALPGSQLAATAGLHNYNGQLAWRNYLRSSGLRVRGTGNGTWGQQAGKQQRTATAAAAKLAKAQAAGTAQGKAQAQVARAGKAQAQQAQAQAQAQAQPPAA